MFLWTYRENIIFLEFLGFSAQIEVDKIQCLQLPFLYLTFLMQWEVSNKERDFWLVLCDKVELLQLVRRNFWLGPRNWARNSSFFIFLFIFFFFLLVKGQLVNRSMLTRSTLTSDPCRCSGQTWRPFKVHQVAWSVQGPKKGPWGSILSILTSFLWILSSKKFFGASCGLVRLDSSFSPQLQSPILHLRLVSIFSFFLFSASMSVSKQVGKHASTYFIFGIFAYMFLCFHHLCHGDVGKYICSHV